MTQKEKFEVWDATHPEVKEVRAYLDRLCGKTPLPLVYSQKEENVGKVVCDVLPDELANLIGILIAENTVVYLRALTKNDILPDFNITEEAVNAWVKRQFTDFPNAHAATKSDIKVLDKVRSLVLDTLEILDYHGVSIPHPSWKYLGYVLPLLIGHWDGSTEPSYYLRHYGDVLVFSDYSEDEVAKATIRNEFFKSAGT